MEHLQVGDCPRCHIFPRYQGQQFHVHDRSSRSACRVTEEHLKAGILGVNPALLAAYWMLGPCKLLSLSK